MSSRREFLSQCLLGAATLAAAPAVRAVEGGPAGRPDGAAIERLVRYFAQCGPLLLRPARGVLRHPSISPTLPHAAYSTQLWDWDTLWTTRGLLSLARRTSDAPFRAEVCLHAQGSLANFFDHQAPDGRIPIMIDETNPDPLGCLRPGDGSANQAKPVLAQLALLVADATGDAGWFEPHFERLAAFHESWNARNRSPLGLYVWGNDVAIGVDNDPTTFGRPPFSSANLLLNCLFYADFKAAAELARRLGRTREAAALQARASELGECLQRYCWDSRDRFFYTVDVQCTDRRAELLPDIPRGMATSWRCLPLRVQMFTGFLPMECGLADAAQAEALVRLHLANPATFQAAFGVRTLSASEPMYQVVFSSNPSDWLGPIWILSNYLVWKGLKAYRYEAEADALAGKTLRLLCADLEASGSLNEYYHPDTGAPMSHRGFVDWNLLAIEMAEG